MELLLEKNKLKKISLHIVLFLLLSQLNAFAKITLPAMFGDNMVLQQNSSVAIWGKGNPSSLIYISCPWFTGGTKQHPIIEYVSITDKNGNWRTSIKTPKAGGPYTITIYDKDTLKLNNVLIGEVWFCSGQSNMEMPMRGFKNQPVLNSNEILLNADNSQLRLFETKRNATILPVDTITGEWKISNAESASEFSAVAYMYGKMLQEKLKVPVGIIVSSWGGTKIQSWMDAESLKDFPKDINEYITKADTAKERHKIPTTLFNGMIAPFVGYGIKGFLWYQGETNRYDPAGYLKLFPKMVSSWRTLWQSKDSLPFYYVQIAPYGNKDTTKSVKGIREAQMKAMSLIPNSGMVSTMDIGNEIFIHSPYKKEVSERLLFWALAKTYGYKGISYCGPIYKSMTINKNIATIKFDFAENGLSSFGSEIVNFEMAGDDKIFYPASAKIQTDGTLDVWCDKVTNPVAVRYGWKDYVKGELFNTAGLPASSFRTDDW
jgi:sialate O-acetylesterase